MPNWVSVLLIVAYNVLSGLTLFELVQPATTAGKWVAFFAWIVGNLPALLGKQLVRWGKGVPAAMLMLLGALGLAVAAAGCTTTNAYRVIDSAASLGRTGFDLVHELDVEKQHEIAAEKATIGEAAAAAKVEAWREKRDTARKALKTFIASVATAEATLNLIVAGQEKRITLSMVIAEVAKMVTQIRGVLEVFGVKVPALSARQAIGIAVAAATPMAPFVGELATPPPIGWSAIQGLRTVSCAVAHPPGVRCSWETGEGDDLCDPRMRGIWNPDAWKRECEGKVR
jgi:hypothetical protein